MVLLAQKAAQYGIGQIFICGRGFTGLAHRFVDHGMAGVAGEAQLIQRHHQNTVHGSGRRRFEHLPQKLLQQPALTLAAVGHVLQSAFFGRA